MVAAGLFGLGGAGAADAATAAGSDGADAPLGPALTPAAGLSLLAPLSALVQPAPAPLLMAQADAGAAPDTVGKPPEEEDEFRPELGGLNVGGVLTPTGMVVVEPSFTYSHTGTNRFTFRGTEIVETILLGVVEAEDADRDFMETAVGFRYGLTDRIELEARFPYVFRNDTVRTTANIGGTDVAVNSSLDNDGLGDIELGAHYQINQGGGGWPFLVANMRGKLATGTGPFDVDRDPNGIETELPTGSGFYAVEPSLSIIYPSDPVVLFASIGYLWNIKRDIDKQVGGAEIGRVNPGDSIRFGFGFSFAVNEAMSFSISYSQDMIGKTSTQVDQVWVKGEDLTVGQVSIGLSHRINDWMSIDLGTTFGVTSDANDVAIGVRLPMRFQLFDY